MEAYSGANSQVSIDSLVDCFRLPILPNGVYADRRVRASGDNVASIWSVCQHGRTGCIWIRQRYVVSKERNTYGLVGRVGESLRMSFLRRFKGIEKAKMQGEQPSEVRK